MLVIGSSETGKTFLVRKMLLRGDLGPKARIQVAVFIPCEASRQQPIYKDLARRGIDIKVFGDLEQAIKSLTRPGRRLLILDDVDGPDVGKKVINRVASVFTTESHHALFSCIMISHHLKTGSPILRGSAPVVVLTSAPREQLEGFAREICLDPALATQMIDYLLEDKNADKKVFKGELCYHHIVISRSPGAHPLWTVKDSYYDSPGVVSWG